MQTQDFIGTAEVARLMGVDRSTVTRHVASGELEAALTVPGYRGHFLFDPGYIAAVVAGK